MKLNCSRCNLRFEEDWTFYIDWSWADRKQKREMLDSALCPTCSGNVKVRPTALGALVLACHVPHKSGKLTENVSRETIDQGGEGV